MNTGNFIVGNVDLHLPYNSHSQTWPLPLGSTKVQLTYVSVMAVREANFSIVCVILA